MSKDRSRGWERGLLEVVALPGKPTGSEALNGNVLVKGVRVGIVTEAMSEIEDKAWQDLVARWRTAYGHAYASQVRLVDTINSKCLGHDASTIKVHMQIADEMWSIEARRREELNRFIKRHFG